jgi:hypothetical protein
MAILVSSDLDGKKTQKKKKHHQVKRVRLKNRTKARQQDARYHGRKDDQEQDEIIQTKHSGFPIDY